MKVSLFQVHKRSSYIYSSIQDKFSYDLDSNVFAISDGATQGYKSEIWAEKLVDCFHENPIFDIDKLIDDFRNQAIEFSTIKNAPIDNIALRLAEERKRNSGGFATFLGTKIDNDSLRYISSGDVCGFILSDDKVKSFPFQNLKELDSDKGFLSTKKLIDSKSINNQFKKGNIKLYEGDTILLMTDAIARLCLKDLSTIRKIIHLNNYADFFDFIIELWDTKKLEEDDITILKIEHTKGKKVAEEFLPQESFSFPKMEQSTFNYLTQQNLSNEEMKQIEQQLQQLNYKIENYQKGINELLSENNRIREELRMIKLIFFSIVGLSILTSIAYYGYDKYMNKKVSEKNIQTKTSIKNRK